MSGTVVLFGATAVGKSAVLESVARDRARENGSGGDPGIEIISADSRQVYRGLDLGTAKPSGCVRDRIPHHLIDLLDPRETFDVGRFVRACDRLVPEIRARGRRPIISGGTAFYLRAYLFGLPETPAVGEDVRQSLRERARVEGVDALRQELRRVDPVSADRIGENDEYRILRALEVYHTTGRPRSSFAVPEEVRTGLEVTVIGLYREREMLYERINRRVEEMFDLGLPAEAEQLYRNGYNEKSPGMRTIGYREFFELGGPPPWTREQRSMIKQRIARNTRHYARRQELFFKRLPGVRWFDADDYVRLKPLLTIS